MDGISSIPAIAASMMASVQAFKAATQMAQVSTQILAGAEAPRAALPYSSLLDKLA